MDNVDFGLHDVLGYYARQMSKISESPGQCWNIFSLPSTELGSFLTNFSSVYELQGRSVQKPTIFK